MIAFSFWAKRTMRARVSLAAVLLFAALFGWILLPGPSAAANAAASDAAASNAATPTPAPGTKIARFTASSMNKDAPIEAIQSIDLALSRADYPGCMDNPEAPTLDFKTDDLDLTGIAMVATCGWQPDEIVKVTLMDPTGKLTTRQVKAVPAKHLKDVYEVDLTYQPGINAPEGKYRFTLEGTAKVTPPEGMPPINRVVKAKVGFNRPKGARMYAASVDAYDPQFTALGGQQRLQLTGFLPDEPVRLLAYRTEDTRIQFYGWQDYVTDKNGRLIVETDLPGIPKDEEMNYFAYARETHFVPLERFTNEGFSKSRQFEMDLYCPGALAPRINGPAEIRGVEGSSKVNIHYQPGFGARLTAQVPGDTPMRVYGYPKCIDHAFWWKVAVNKPITFGWVSESSALGKYIIETLKK